MDYKSIKTMLEKRCIPVDNILTEENKEIFNECILTYQLSNMELKKVILGSLTGENTLDMELFKNGCHNLSKSKEEKPNTKEEQLIHIFETISTKQLLEDLSNGNQAPARELNLINDMTSKYGLPAPVMNVLVHYVLIQSDMKLSKPYMDTIASHWSRARLKNAKEAMAFAKSEVQKFREMRRPGKKDKKLAQ